MDANEEKLIGRRRRRRWLALLVSVPFLAVMGASVWYFLAARQRAFEQTLVEQISGAAFGCVASMRGDAPEAWGLPRALDHMSRMERVTREADEASDERARFARLAIDAARGCEELGSLLSRTRTEAPDLYFAVPATLAQPPEEGAAERWFRRVVPKSRAEVEELTRQIRAMQEAINARRGEHSLMPTELPIEGHEADRLARVVDLAPLPRELPEDPVTEVWPLPSYVLVLRRGSIARVACDTRFVNRASCYSELVQTVAWDGTPGEPRLLERPASVSYWAAFAPTQDGTLWAVGADRQERGVLGRYAPDATRPEVAPIGAVIDGVARITEIIGGVAVLPSDGSVWTSSGGLALTQSPDPPLRVVLTPPEDEEELDPSLAPARGVSVDGVGTLSVFGSQEDGFTSRLSTATGDVLLRIIDAHSRARAVVSLRALRDGHAVALFRRNEEGPDALTLTTDFGRTWLAD